MRRLVTVDEESDIIRLVHHTTQEYCMERQSYGVFIGFQAFRARWLAKCWNKQEAWYQS